MCHPSDLVVYCIPISREKSQVEDNSIKNRIHSVSGCKVFDVTPLSNTNRLKNTSRTRFICGMYLLPWPRSNIVYMVGHV